MFFLLIGYLTMMSCVIIGTLSRMLIKSQMCKVIPLPSPPEKIKISIYYDKSTLFHEGKSKYSDSLMINIMATKK